MRERSVIFNLSEAAEDKTAASAKARHNPPKPGKTRRYTKTRGAVISKIALPSFKLPDLDE